MKKITMMIGAALAVALGSVHAEPLALNEAQMDGITAGTGFTIDVSYFKTVDIFEIITEEKIATFDVTTSVTGWSAVAEATSDCVGLACDSQTFTGTQIDLVGIAPDGSNLYKTASFSKSIALAN